MFGPLTHKPKNVGWSTRRLLDGLLKLEISVGAVAPRRLPTGNGLISSYPVQVDVRQLIKIHEQLTDVWFSSFNRMWPAHRSRLCRDYNAGGRGQAAGARRRRPALPTPGPHPVTLYYYISQTGCEVPGST